MAEIRNALAVGKEVITHTDAVSVPGWSGAGYIILDPVTGSGAYKIGGGSNGGFLGLFLALLVTFIALFVAATMLITGTFWVALAGAALLSFETLSLLQWRDAINSSSSIEDLSRANSGQFLVGLMGALPVGVPLRIFGVLTSWMIVNNS